MDSLAKGLKDHHFAAGPYGYDDCPSCSANNIGESA
jgi:hypothetical protein